MRSQSAEKNETVNALSDRTTLQPFIFSQHLSGSMSQEIQFLSKIEFLNGKHDE